LNSQIILQNISPYKSKYNYDYECFDVACISVIKSLNRDYELMYSQAWDFDYVQEDKSHCLKDKIISYRGEIYDLLLKFHGIKIIKLENKLFKSYKIIEENISNSLPVLVSIDTYFCPWDNYHFMLEHDNLNHFIVIIGVNNDTRNFICIDHNYSSNYQLLPFDYFNNGYMNTIIVFNKIEDYESPNCYELIISHLNNLLKNKFSNKIITFGSDLLNLHNIREQITLKNIPEDILFLKLKLNLQSRFRYSEYLAYIANNHNDNKLMEFSTDVGELGFRWQSIYSLLIKSVLSGNSNHLKMAGEKVIEIASIEYKYINKLLKSVDKKNNFTKGKITKNLNTNIDNINPDDLVYIDLSNSYNNKAFGNSIESSANITNIFDTPEFYLINEELRNEYLITKDIVYKLPPLMEELFDNISCNTQIIDLPLNRYRFVFFLGCSVFGDFLENIIFVYSDSKKEVKKLGLSDWDRNEPIFNENIVLKGNHVYKNKLLGENVYILGQKFFLDSNKNLVQLILPDCTNMHIFAITLIK